MTAPGFKRHILVVDDDDLVCETISMLLQCDGHQVDSASNGKQALAAFDASTFDLVITDFFMPAMKGDELAAAIKLRSPGQPVIMISAYPEKLQTPDRPMHSVDFLLGKPFEMDNLRAAITMLSPTHKTEQRASQN
jgi:CheY-like chemotaxis protein